MWKLARTPNHPWRGPVTLGQDNAFVYRDLLGMTEAEYERRRRTGVIGTRYVTEALTATRD